MVRCLKCNNELLAEANWCSICGVATNSVKRDFIEYVGETDSVVGFEKSYKLVILKCVIESILLNGQAEVNDVMNRVRQFYLFRFYNDLPPDFDADIRISEIKNTNDHELYDFIKTQPFKELNEKGFLYIFDNESSTATFVFRKLIADSLCIEEYQKILHIVEEKLELYFSPKEEVVNDEIPSSYDSSEDKQADIYSTDILTKHIHSLSFLSTRTKNALFAAGLNNLQMVVNFSKSNDLMTIKNLGANSYNELVEIIDMCNDLDDINYEPVDTVATNEDLTISIHPSNYDLPISILSLIGVPRKNIASLNSYDYENAGSLDGVNKTEIIKHIRNYRINETLNAISLLESSIISVAIYVIDTIKEDKAFDIYLGRASGLTLQQVADIHEITRERVRQIENNTFNKLQDIFITIFNDQIKEIRKNYISLQSLLDIFDDDDYDKIFIFTLRNIQTIEYLDFAELFVVSADRSISTTTKLTFLAQDFVGDGINFYKKTDELEQLLNESGFNYITTDAILNLLLSVNARFYGDYIFFGKKSYGYLAARVVGKYFKDGIEIYSANELDLMKKYALEKYGDIDFPDNYRSLSVRLTTFLILCGRGRFIAPENVSVDLDLLEQIIEYINSLEYANVYYHEIFGKFEDQLRLSGNIDNHHFLHGILVYFFPNEYNYSRDYLTKNDHEVSISLTERISKILTTRGTAVHKNEIVHDLRGISEVMVANVIIATPKFMQWEHNYYNSLDNIPITDQEMSEIELILKQLLDENDGYTNDALLYDRVSAELSDMLIRCKINNSSNLFYLTGCLFADKYRFTKPHISYFDYLEQLTTKNIARKLLKGKTQIRYNDFLAMSNKLMWPDQTFNTAFLEIEQNFIRVSFDEYILKSEFNISESALDQISLAIKSKLTDYHVLSTINFNDFDYFPNIGYGWNIYLLISIVENFDVGYKAIYPKIRNRRYPKVIIVPGKCEFNSLDEIVVHAMKYHSINNIPENKYISFLSANNFILKIISKELYDSELITLNDGIISIKTNDTIATQLADA